MDLIKKKIREFDYILFFLVCGLSIFGIIVIGSATHINTGVYSQEYERQKIWFITGIAMMTVTSFIDYKFIARFYIVFYVLNLTLLALVLRFGTATQLGATRQLGFGGFSIQPSEFAKLFMVIYLSKIIDRIGDRINNIGVLLLLAVSVLLPVYLVKEQPSLSASFVVIAIALVTVFVGGLSFKYITAALAIGIPLAIIVIQDILRPNHLFIHYILTDEYQINDRIIPFLRPELASKDLLYQTNQSISAIASGRISGAGLYQGTLNNLNFLPESHNDFIFAVIGEEFGYMGCMAVLAVIFLIVLKCIYNAHRADTMTGRLMASAVGFMFTFQTFVNVGVATGLLPNTGISLPFVSYGGSAMWINMVCVGLVMNAGIVRKTKSIFEE